MLFNSYEFILVFLPLTAAVYFTLGPRSSPAARAWLALASLTFYGWWSIRALPILLGSMAFNYLTGTALATRQRSGRPTRLLLAAGVAANLLALGWFKYRDFLVENLNAVASTRIPASHVALPLGISFFTFTQIAFLVDASRGETRELDPVGYLLFVTFFPHLIAGPILHHGEMMPQFADPGRRPVSHRNVATGTYLFAMGLFKKTIVADALAPVVAGGFDVAPRLSLLDAWIVTLAYGIQLYADFSGYTDMALGAARMLNIELPRNFDSPYQALDLQDFWRRWHMTLSRFLRTYVYVPLGGSRGGEGRTSLNLLATFLVGGIWHGAGWNFVAWGLLHGTGLVVLRRWRRRRSPLPRPVAWGLTFAFVNVCWVPFRARHPADALKVLRGLAGLEGLELPASLARGLGGLGALGVSFGDALGQVGADRLTVLALVVGLLVVARARCSDTLAAAFVPDRRRLAATLGLAALGLAGISGVSEFLYFDF